MYEELRKTAETAARELIEAARLEKGDLMVVGCSSSEIIGHKIGSDSNEEVGGAVFSGIYTAVKEKGIYLATQCCEHLNRSLILEREAAKVFGLETVNVVPQKKAGGSFSVAAYAGFEHPVAVEELHCAKAGMDIGDTLIGMHMAKVAVPVRLSERKMGEANLVCARVRPKFIGGERAQYNTELK